jgi:hypothetical protein
MSKTREQAMKDEQTERALRQNNQLIDLVHFLELADTEANETIDQLERA